MIDHLHNVAVAVRKRAKSDDEIVCADRLQASALHLLRLLRKMDSVSGVSAGQLAILSRLAYDGPATVGELARREQVRSPTMTGSVRDLEAAGLVRRAHDGADRRRVRVEITSRGGQALEEWRHRRIRPIAELLRKLPSAQTEGIDRSFALVEKVLEDALAPDRPQDRARGVRAPS